MLTVVKVRRGGGTTREANKPLLIVIDAINKLIKKPFNCSNIA